MGYNVLLNFHLLNLIKKEASSLLNELKLCYYKIALNNKNKLPESKIQTGNVSTQAIKILRTVFG